MSVLGLNPEVPAERTGVRRQLGYQPQEVGFPRGFTAFAFVDYIALLKEWTQPAARHAEVRRVLDLVGLSDLVMTVVLQSLLAELADDHVIFGALHATDGLLILAIPAYLYVWTGRRAHDRHRPAAEHHRDGTVDRSRRPRGRRLGPDHPGLERNGHR